MTIQTIYIELCNRAAAHAAKAKPKQLVASGLDPVIAEMLDEYAQRPVMMARGARGRLVEEIVTLHNRLKLPTPPPPRPSIDRWLKPMKDVGDKKVSPRLVPSLPKFLVLALAIEVMTVRATK